MPVGADRLAGAREAVEGVEDRLALLGQLSGLGALLPVQLEQPRLGGEEVVVERRV